MAGNSIETDRKMEADSAFMREVLYASDDCIKVIDLEGRLVYMSEGGQRVMEVDDFDAIRNCPWPDFWVGDGNAAAKGAIEAAQQGRSQRFVGFANTAKGSPRWWDVQVSPILGADGRPERILSISRDITATKKAEEAALRSERRMRETLKAGSLGHWELDLKRMELQASEVCKLNFGRAADEGFTYEDLRDAVHPDDRNRMQAAVGDTIGSGADYDIQYKIIKPDGGLAWVLIRAQLVRDDQGLPSSMSGISLDITELKQTEERLARSEERLQLALGASSMVGIWDWDFRTDLIYADPNFAEIYNVAPDRAGAGAPLAEFTRHFHPDDLPAFEAELKRAFDGKPVFTTEYRIVHPDSGIRWVQARGRLIRDDEGAAIRFSGAAMEITELKQAEETQRLLMNELAHRVKNTLSVVQAISQQTLRNSTTLEDASQKIQARIDALAKAHDVLVQRSWLGADISDVVGNTLDNLGMADAGRVHVVGEKLVLGPRAAMAFGLVLHELMTNAVKYGALSNETGVIDIAWSVTSGDDSRKLLFTWREAGGPTVAKPERKGFGSRLIGASLREFGVTTLEFEASGLELELVAPMEKIEAGSHAEA